MKVDDPRYFGGACGDGCDLIASKGYVHVGSLECEAEGRE